MSSHSLIEIYRWEGNYKEVVSMLFLYDIEIRVRVSGRKLVLKDHAHGYITVVAHGEIIRIPEREQNFDRAISGLAPEES